MKTPTANAVTKTFPTRFTFFSSDLLLNLAATQIAKISANKAVAFAVLPVPKTLHKAISIFALANANSSIFFLLNVKLSLYFTPLLNIFKFCDR